MIRLAIITKSASTKSGSRVAFDLAYHLQKFYDITILAQKDHLQKNLKASLFEKNIKLILYKNMLDLYKFLKKGEFDIVSFHSTLLPMITTKLIGIPIVRTYYGTQFDAYLERLLPPQTPNFAQRVVNFFANGIIWLDQKIMLLLASHVVAISKAAQEELKKIYDKNSSVVYIGSNLKPTTHYPLRPRSEASPLPTTHYPLTILSVSRFTPYKGFHFLMNTINSIKKQGINVRLIIAGSDEKRNYLKYLQKIKDRKDQIILGPSELELRKLYQGCHILASCDRYLFFGLPLLEAAQFAKPVVTLNYLAADELVIHGKTGYLANSQKEFEKYLKILLRNNKLRLTIGKSAQEFANKTFNYTKIAASYHEIFQKSVKKKQVKDSAFKAKIVLTLFGILFPILILEIYARVIIGTVYPQTLPFFFQESTNSILELKPNITRIFKSKKSGEFTTNVKINSQGLRNDKNYQIPKPANTFRIIMLGDSFTFGYGVQNEATFSKTLEKSLEEKFPEKHFEVINAGFASGFTWDESYLYVKEKAAILEPDLIIENAYLGNDIIEIDDHYYPQIDRLGLPEKIKSKTTYVSEEGLRTKFTFEAQTPRLFAAGIFNKFICDHLASCKIIRPFVERNIALLNSKINPRRSLPYFQFLEDNLNPRIDESWHRGQKMLIGLAKLARDNQSEFLIVNIPVKEQVFDHHNILKYKKLNEKRLENFSKDVGIPYCDTAEKLKEKAKLVYFKFDSHLTETGHQQIAIAVENCILNGILKTN